MTNGHEIVKLDRSLEISDKIIKLLEEEKLDFDHSIYAVMSTLLHLHQGKSHCMMNQCLITNAEPTVFLEYLQKDWKRCDGVAENILQRVKEMDKHMFLSYLEQKGIRYR